MIFLGFFLTKLGMHKQSEMMFCKTASYKQFLMEYLIRMKRFILAVIKSQFFYA